jgi:molybdopterin-guanine dinucleotide biosynthesis protein MobB
MTRMPRRKPVVISIVGKSDTGKTTLIEKLVPCFVSRGLRVGSIKHDAHSFEIDREGKDSYRHKKAGTTATIISSPAQIAMVREADHDHSIAELVEAYLTDLDVVLTEGYKRESWPKVEVHRKALARPLLATPDEGLLAVATDEKLDVPVPQFGLDEAEAIVQFLVERFQLRPTLIVLGPMVTMASVALFSSLGLA